MSDYRYNTSRRKIKMLIAKNLTRKFGRKVALDSVSFTLGKSGIVGLVGNNGAGKTTLINTIMGYYMPTSGSITLNEQGTFNNVICSNSMIIIDEKAGYDYLKTLEGNAKKIASARPDFYIDRFYANMEIFGLSNKSLYTKLSKGMKNQFNICIGLAFDKEIYVLDEPAAGLDEAARDKFYTMLNDAFCKNRKQYIVSTHLFAEIQDLTSKVILLRDGKCVYTGDTEELRGKFITIGGASEAVEALLTDRKSYNTERVMNYSCILIDNNLTRMEKKYIEEHGLTVTLSKPNESSKVLCNYDYPASVKDTKIVHQYRGKSNIVE